MDDLPQRLAEALRVPASRRVPTRDCAPTLSYGRHRGPARADARGAAVAITFLRRADGGWSLPLTLRPLSLRHHAGQVCFPGGRIEPGETPTQAALREFEEELGLLPGDPCELGHLEPLYVYASNHLVFPVLFAGDAPDRPWQPDPTEVDAVIELPLEQLHPSQPPPPHRHERSVLRATQVVGQYHFDTKAYELDRYRIWGATAMMLNHLAKLIGRAD